MGGGRWSWRILTIFSEELAKYRGRVGFKFARAAKEDARKYIKENVPRTLARLRDNTVPPLKVGSRVDKLSDLEWMLSHGCFIFIEGQAHAPHKVIRMRRPFLKQKISAGVVFLGLEK